MPKERETLPDENIRHDDEVDVAEEAGDLDGQEDLEAVIAQRDDYFDQLQRSRAEFINFRKRNDQERLKLAELFRGETLRQFLPVIDDFDRAMAAVPADERETGWVSGITMIQKKFHDVLERNGVTEIDALNQPFDPSKHEAVATDADAPGNDVVEVYQKGYMIGNTLLRPAMVKTGKVITPQA